MPRSTSKRVTLQDVANAAEVSSQTVSRVVNGHRYVSEATRRRVQDAITDLGYRPNRAARSLATQRSCMLGIISFGLGYYGPSQMVYNIEQAARGRGYGVSLSSVSTIALTDLGEALDDLLDRSVDGLVFITPVGGVEHEDLGRICHDVPFVLIDTQLGSQVPSVVIDQQHGTRLVTEHLLDLGHRTIAEISGPLNWFGAQARHRSWIKTLRSAGLEPGPSVEGDWTSRSGFEGMQRLLATGTAFTGLVVANDQMALGAIRALRQAGLRVPEDVSVTGFDDIPEAAYFEPPLTTIRQNFAALGEQSVEYLLALVDKPHTPLHQRVLYPELVARESTRRLD
jgi:DNA-binding LacI/PurR family transcriptional regulator